MEWNDSSGKAINVLNPYVVDKLNIHAQSTQNSFANIFSRIYFSYLLIVVKQNREIEEDAGGEDKNRSHYLLHILNQFKANTAKLHNYSHPLTLFLLIHFFYIGGNMRLRID